MRDSSRWMPPLLLLSSLLVACSETPTTQEEPPPPPELLASWGGGELTVADLDAHLLSLPMDARWPAEGEDSMAWRRKKLDEMFLSRHYDALVDTAELEGDEQFRTTFESQRRAILAQAYLEMSGPLEEVTESDARDYFTRFRHEFSQPETRILANLLLAFPPGADEAAKTEVCERAEALRHQIESGASFDSMARQHSDSSTAATGGHVGQVERSHLRGEAAEVVFSLEVGKVSRVVRSRAGCQLFLVRQVAPAFEARFEAVMAIVFERLRTARMTARYLELYREELERLGVEAPVWTDEAGEEALAEDTVHFELEGHRVTGLDVQQRMRTGIAAEQALPQLTSELVLALAMQREAPQVAAERAQALRRRLGRDYLEHQQRRREVEALPNEVLREHFERNAARFTREASVELTVVSWPIGSGDPLSSMQRPRAFAAAAREADGDVDSIWKDYEADDGVVLQSVPLMPLRTLAQRQPSIARQLTGDLRSGLVVPPFADRQRIVVLVVDSYLEPRPMSFVEAVDQVRQDYAERNAATLERRRVAALKEEVGFRRYDENLATLGARLLDKLLVGQTDESREE